MDVDIVCNSVATGSCWLLMGWQGRSSFDAFGGIYDEAFDEGWLPASRAKAAVEEGYDVYVVFSEAIFHVVLSGEAVYRAFDAALGMCQGKWNVKV